MRVSSVVFSVLIAGSLIAGSGVARAQEVRVGWGLSRVRHQLLGTAAGPELSWLRNLSPAMGLEVAYARLGGDQERDGIACGGFIVLECPRERVHDASRLHVADVRLPLTLAQRPGARLSLTPGLGVTVVKTQTRGLTTRNELGVTEVLGNLQLGAELHLHPAIARRLTAHARVSAGQAERILRIEAEDGYFPYASGFGFVHATIGLGYQLGR